MKRESPVFTPLDARLGNEGGEGRDGMGWKREEKRTEVNRRWGRFPSAMFDAAMREQKVVTAVECPRPVCQFPIAARFVLTATLYKTLHFQQTHHSCIYNSCNKTELTSYTISCIHFTILV